MSTLNITNLDKPTQAVAVVDASGAQITSFGASLTGTKGVDGATIATRANPIPIEVESGGAALTYNANGRAADAASSPVALSNEDVTLLQNIGGANNSYKHIAAGQATTVVKASAGVLHSITFHGAATATNTTTVYDNASGSGTVIAIPTATAVTAPVTVTYDVAFSLGCTIITATANGCDMTVSYR